MLACLAAVVALTACTHREQIVVSLPRPMIRFHVDESSGPMRIWTSSVNGSRTGRDCGAPVWHTWPIRESGLVRLSISTTDPDVGRVRDWLERPNPNAPGAQTNAALLASLSEAVESALLAMSSRVPRWPPVHYVLRFSPPDCRYGESILIVDPLQAREIALPIVFAASIIGPRLDSTAALIDHLALILAHETAHVIQLHPFTQQRAERMIHDPISLTHGHAMGLSGEFEARLVDHCIKQALVPDGPRRRDYMQSLVQALSEGRQRPNISPDAASEQIHVSAMQVVTSVLGANWLDPDDASLRKLFPHCVMALDGRLTPGQAGTPTEEDVRRGEAALQAIRHVVAEPIRFPGAFH